MFPKSICIKLGFFVSGNFINMRAKFHQATPKVQFFIIELNPWHVDLLFFSCSMWPVAPTYQVWRSYVYTSFLLSEVGCSPHIQCRTQFSEDVCQIWQQSNTWFSQEQWKIKTMKMFSMFGIWQWDYCLHQVWCFLLLSFLRCFLLHRIIFFRLWTFQTASNL